MKYQYDEILYGTVYGNSENLMSTVALFLRNFRKKILLLFLKRKILVLHKIKEIDTRCKIIDFLLIDFIYTTYFSVFIEI